MELYKWIRLVAVRQSIIESHIEEQGYAHAKNYYQYSHREDGLRKARC